MDTLLTPEQLLLIRAANSNNSSDRATILLAETSKEPLTEQKLTCPICIHPYHCPNEDGDIEVPVQTKCGHIFGNKCFEILVQDILGMHKAVHCPLCRDMLVDAPQPTELKFRLEIRNEQVDLEPWLHRDLAFDQFYRLANTSPTIVNDFYLIFNLPWDEEFELVIEASLQVDLGGARRHRMVDFVTQYDRNTGPSLRPPGFRPLEYEGTDVPVSGLPRFLHFPLSTPANPNNRVSLVLDFITDFLHPTAILCRPILDADLAIVSLETLGHRDLYEINREDRSRRGAERALPPLSVELGIDPETIDASQRST